MAKIKFGTDGWRAVIAEDFTFENLDRVAQATAVYWAKNPEPGTEKKVVVGYDRRFLSDQFATRTAEILAGNGFQVILSKAPNPTQAVSLAVKKANAVGGVMITASHNPAIFNGFKLKGSFGGSAESSMCQAIEKLVDAKKVKAIPLAEAKKAKKIQVKDLNPALYAAAKKLVNFKLIANSGVRFAHDALFGVGAGCFDAILKGTSCQVTTLNGDANPLFGGINPEPVKQNYGLSSAYLKKNPHDICLVTDGDADRVGAMDGKGGYLTSHQLICMLLRHMRENRGLDGRVVKALTTTSMVDKMCAHYGLECVETGVGFKYVAAEMLKGDVLLGAEESGGIGFLGHIPERDGIAAGMMLLEMLAMEGKSVKQILSALTRKFGPHCYARIDTHYPLEKRDELIAFVRDNPPAKLNGSPVADVKSYDGVKVVADSGAWLMIRGSGTEPILRIYAEADSDANAEKLLKMGVAFTKKV